MRISVVGGGVFGLMASLKLQEMGAKVRVFHHPRLYQQSYDSTRAWMVEYGRDHFASKLMLESLEGWRALEKESGRELIARTGQVILAEIEFLENIQSDPFMLERGYISEILDPQEANQQLEWLNPSNQLPALIDPQAGFIRSAEVMKVLWEKVKSSGAEVINAKAQKVGARQVRLENDKAIESEAVLVCAGAYTSQLLDLRLRLVAQHVLVVKYPQAEELPFVTDQERHHYLMPASSDEIKLGGHGRIAATDNYLNWAKKVLERPLGLEASYCQKRVYDVSPNYFPVIGSQEGVYYLTGSSGQGFKFAPRLAEIAAHLILEGEPVPRGLGLYQSIRF